MSAEHLCPDCHVPMAEGFIPELNVPKLSEWYAGKPEFGIFGALMLKGTSIPITTYRCPECGFLRSHAVKTTES